MVANEDGTYTYTRRGSQTFNFSSSGQLVSESDPNGYQTTLSYNGSGQLTTVTDPAGRQLNFSYGTNGLVSKVTDPSSRSVSYAYDSPGELTSVTDLDGGVTSFTYGTGHLLSTMTGPNGGVTTNTYNSSGQVTQQVDPMGRTTTFAYSGDNLSSSGGTTTITDPDGNVTVEDYVSGALMSETQASGTWRQLPPTTRWIPTPCRPPRWSTRTATSPLMPMTPMATWSLRSTHGPDDHLDLHHRRPGRLGDAARYVRSAGTVTTAYSYDQAGYCSGGAGNLTSVSTPVVVRRDERGHPGHPLPAR